MKNLLNSTLRCIRKTALLLGLLTLGAFLSTGCDKKQVLSDGDEINAAISTATADAQILDEYNGLPAQTMWELQQARAATARYRNIKNAIKDGYADIEVVVENMGYHYMKSGLLDATFDIRKPELLVYNETEQGSFELVAVEYAVPINLSPTSAPAGFTGTQDVWDRNSVFGLWLLHAWVWSYNPSGVFNPTNPLVHLH